MSYKTITETVTLADAISGAYSALQELRDEMAEWAENLENGNLSHTQKAEDVRACAEGLDGHVDDEPEVPEGVSGETLQVSARVNTRRGRTLSRAMRRDNAVARLQAAADWLTDYVDDGGTEEDDEAEERADAEELRDTLENVISDAEGLEFPSAF